MSTVLVLTSSVLGEASASNQLVRGALSNLKAFEPGIRVISRDIGGNPVAHITADTLAALQNPETTDPAQLAAQSLSNQLIDELKAADLLLIGAPMYNFGIPSTLKAWFDYVLRAGVTFRYSESGPEGLLTGKRAIVVETRGGLYSQGPAVAMDSQEPHLRTLLNFIGITDVTFIRAEKLAFGPEERELATTAAAAQLAEAVNGELSAAA